MTATFSGPGTKFVRAGTASEHAILPRRRLQTAFQQADFQVIAQRMLALTFRSVSSGGFLVIDPASFFSQVGVSADTPRRRRSPPGTKQGTPCPRPPATTAITSGSESSSMALPGTRRAYEISPGVTPHSCQPPEQRSAAMSRAETASGAEIAVLLLSRP
jgi:hypothetical protein